MDTAWKIFYVSYKLKPKNNFIGYRKYLEPEKDLSKRDKYSWINYEEFGSEILSFGNSLKYLKGLKHEHENIGIFCSNRPEWILCHLGNLSQNYRTVALYDTLGAQAVEYIITHSQLPVILCEKNKLKHLFTAIQNAKNKHLDEENEKEDEIQEEESHRLRLKYIIQVDYHERYNNKHEIVDDKDIEQALNLGCELIGLSKFLLLSEKEEHKVFHPSKPDDIAYIMYTSGTTGNPKGVLLPHRAFASIAASAEREIKPSEQDVHISYLPLAHIFEAMVQSVLISVAGSIAFFGGDIRFISKDWKDVRPTILCGVPRVFNKTYDKYKLKVENELSGVKKLLVQSAEASSTQQVRQGKRSSFYDKLVWTNIATELGFDRTRFVISGAAPLPAHVGEFLRVVVGSNAVNGTVHQGYGLTETCAAITITNGKDFTLGHVGSPIDNTEIRLIDAPECNYRVTDEPYARGEIQCRGPGNMLGYYKDIKKTQEVLSQDGWFSTGDIGRINPNGTISIIDRRKNMFKTSSGEYIASEKIETILSKTTGLQQVWIYGNSFKSFIVAVVVPDAQYIREVYKNKDWDENDESKPGSAAYIELFQKVVKKNEEEVKKLILDNIRKIEKEAKLEKFECVQDVYVEINIDSLLQGFTVDNDTLTPSFKLKKDHNY